MSIMLAVDGGGTRTRCIAVDRDGTVRGAGDAGPSNHLHVTMAAATEALRAAAEQALSAAGATDGEVALVSAGLAGVDYDGTGADEGARMLHAAGFERVLVHGDMVIAHRGALAGAPGVVALAGTGSSVLGIAADGTTIKAGGWGPVYGDQGSAYQLGRLGLVAAAEAYDGCGPMTALVERLRAALEASSFPQTVHRVYSDPLAQRRVAALATVVNATAEEGDEVARSICQRAGSDLGRAVLAVIRRLPGSERTVSYQGAVLAGSRLMRASFVERIAAAGLGIEVRAPRFEPIIGAALLGSRAAGWHLHADAMEKHVGL